jgi:hypothetical protein
MMKELKNGEALQTQLTSSALKVKTTCRVSQNVALSSAQPEVSFAPDAKRRFTYKVAIGFNSNHYRQKIIFQIICRKAQERHLKCALPADLMPGNNRHKRSVLKHSSVCIAWLQANSDFPMKQLEQWLPVRPCRRVSAEDHSTTKHFLCAPRRKFASPFVPDKFCE